MKKTEVIQLLNTHIGKTNYSTQFHEQGWRQTWKDAMGSILKRYAIIIRADGLTFQLTQTHSAAMAVDLPAIDVVVAYPYTSITDVVAEKEGDEIVRYCIIGLDGALVGVWPVLNPDNPTPP